MHAKSKFRHDWTYKLLMSIPGFGRITSVCLILSWIISNFERPPTLDPVSESHPSRDGPPNPYLTAKLPATTTGLHDTCILTTFSYITNDRDSKSPLHTSTPNPMARTVQISELDSILISGKPRLI